MATSRRQVRSLTDLNAKKLLQKYEGNDLIFEVSGGLATGKVLAAVPVTASAGLLVSGSTITSGSLTVGGNGNVTISNGTLTVTGSIAATQGITLSGTLEFTQDSKITSVPLSSGDGGGSSTLQLIPDKDLIGNDQYLVVDPTAPSHIHLRAGGTIDASTAQLFLGGEKANVQVTDGATHTVAIHSSGSTQYEWVFGNDGKLTLAGDISGSTTTASFGGDLIVEKNTTVKGDLEVVGNMTVRGTPTIINSDVLEVKDNIVVINRISGSSDAYVSESGGLYVNRGNAETASLLWVSSSNDWQFHKTVGGTPSSADLVVNKLKPVLISGSVGVAVNSNLTIAATASLHTSGSFSNITLPTSSVMVEDTAYKVFNLDTAIHAIDNALANAGLSATSVQNAYRALRFQYSGTLDESGEWSGSLPLTQAGKAAFPVADFNYITTDVVTDSGGKWVNDLVAVDIEISASAIWVLISAAAAPNTGFRLVAVNENTESFTI